MTDEARADAIEEALAHPVLFMEDVTEPRGRQGRRHLLSSVLSLVCRTDSAPPHRCLLRR
ncbi:MAG: hypothetical protein EA398_02615 [Deltaproteobacteria bacterium]|nr:MAG: hypothetical protein EA398_02615 [Deltaproteobacteria bacterium]